jgi:hypothetical protein
LPFPRFPWLVKFSATGFVSREWARSEKCEVFEAETFLTLTYPGNSVTYQFQFHSAEPVDELIARALLGPVSAEPNNLCDGPVTSVRVALAKEGADLEEILLYHTGGCGMPKRIRRGPYSSALLDIASTFCPTTH